MWPPAIGVSEMVLLTAVAVAACVFTRRQSRWLLGIVPCFAMGALVTPADPASTLGVGGVLSALYIAAVLVSKWLLREPDE